MYLTPRFKGILLGKVILFVESPVLTAALCFLVGLVAVVGLGVSSYNHSGVNMETNREKEGTLLPLFYLVYYLRDKEQEEEQDNDRVLDYIVDDLGNQCIPSWEIHSSYSTSAQCSTHVILGLV